MLPKEETMKRAKIFGIGLALAMLAPPLAAQEQGSWDGLIEVKASKFDDAFLMPGADFRAYDKVMLDPVEVAFRKDWMRNMNDTRSLGRRISADDAQKILDTVRADTRETFSEAFVKGGFQVADAPGEKVLRVHTSVINLYVNAPDNMSAGRVMTFTTEAGEATLVVELRDSLTNALLARVVDRRVAQNMGAMPWRPTLTNTVTNRAEFERAAAAWASASVKGLKTLQSQSPIPDDLRKGQKLK
jgi:hypothetical protein